jgi:trehalose-6-phosphatase
MLVAIGDDHTDADLFRALPPTAITVAVGDRPAGARFHLPDHEAVRRVLYLLTNTANAEDAAAREPRWPWDAALS